MRWLFLVVFAALAPASAALAQNPYAPAIMVNEGVITRYDIDQRIKLLEALGASADLRKLAVQQLTEDRVKVQAANDFLVFGSVAIASFSAGGLLSAGGWTSVNWLVFPPVAIALALVAWQAMSRQAVAKAG